MIRVDKSEQFPITVSLLAEDASQLVTGASVYYDIRYIANDVSLSPVISGTLVESSVEPGIYRKTESIDTAGEYIMYVTCSGYISASEEILVNENNIYEEIKNNRHYNISVEDVQRLNAIPTASQTARNVPLNKTDYIITHIKDDDAANWDSPTATGIVYAHYKSGETLPYKMGGST